MFELLYSDNQKTMEYEDILAILKNRTKNFCVMYIFSKGHFPFLSQMIFSPKLGIFEI